MVGRTVSHYRIVGELGAGGPAFVRDKRMSELRRGPAEAKTRSRHP